MKEQIEKIMAELSELKCQTEKEVEEQAKQLAFDFINKLLADL